MVSLFAVAALAATAAQPILPVRAIVETTDISGLVLAPDRHHLAYRTVRARVDRNDYETIWYVADTLAETPPRAVADGGPPLLTDAGTVATPDALWSSDSSTLYFRARHDGAVQIWRAAADGSVAVPITHDEGDISAFQLSPDGLTLTYTAGVSREATLSAQNDAYRNGILVDATVDVGQPLAGGSVVDGQRLMQRFTGRWFVRGPLIHDRPPHRVIVDLANGESRPGEPSQDDKRDPRGQRAPNGDLAEIDAATNRLVVIRRSGTVIACTAKVCRAAGLLGFAWQPDSDALVLRTRDSAQHDSLRTWPIGTGEPRLVTQSSGTLGEHRSTGLGCALAERDAYCTEASALSPPRLVRIAIATGAQRTLFDPNSALRAAIELDAQNLVWADAKGRPFTGILLRAKRSAAAAPLAIDYYDCSGFLRGGIGTELPMLSLASTGIAVLCINETPWTGAQNALSTYQAAQAGVIAAINMLVDSGVTDRHSVGMAGVSFGSEVAMWIALHTPLLSVLAISSMQAEPSYYWANALPGRDVPETLKQVWGVGWPDQDRQGWRRVSPANAIAQLHAPLLLQLPETEARWTMELYARALRDGRAAELYGFPDETHILNQPAHQMASMERTQDWFRFWLQNTNDPDPTKRAQYARWHTLSALNTPQRISRADP